ncbi:MAG: cytochrome c oxidase assembly protein [Proteobacteria bacterium]|nr:cytochrome c oxidase assembly protein [Pseudomonadota bacterium]
MKRITTLSMVSLVIGMFCMAYAAVPLYSLFCKVTGFAGTPKVGVTQLPTQILNRVVTVRFNTDVDPNLQWVFKPEQKNIKIRVGEQRLIFFSAENISGIDETGISAYNVTPEQMGKYINKVKCFCFEKQKLKAGEKMIFPVSFFIDPAMAKDKNVDDVQTITLSYTFFKVKGS